MNVLRKEIEAARSELRDQGVRGLMKAISSQSDALLPRAVEGWPRRGE
jgi:hypothetical protein